MELHDGAQAADSIRESDKQIAVASSVRKGRLSSQEKELVGCRGSVASND